VTGKVTDHYCMEYDSRNLPFNYHPFDFTPNNRVRRQARTLMGKITDVPLGPDNTKDVQPHFVIGGNGSRFDTLRQAIVEKSLTGNPRLARSMHSSAVPLSGGICRKDKFRTPVHWYFDANAEKRLVPFPREQIIV